MQLTDIYKKFGDKVIFDGFNAEFPPNQTTWIMGASGSGKTTLLRIIAGLEEFDGEITGKEGSCSFLFQEDRLLEGLSALDNVKITGVSAEDAERFLMESGLSVEDINRPVYELSGGMKRRTALIRTLLYPKGSIILMDEPFNGLDEENRQKSAGIIAKLRKNRTLITVTHHLSDTELIKGNIINL